MSVWLPKKLAGGTISNKHFSSSALMLPESLSMSGSRKNCKTPSSRPKSAYELHRTKVEKASAAIDMNPPTSRPHVLQNAKRRQLERERQARIAEDNFILRLMTTEEAEYLVDVDDDKSAKCSSSESSTLTETKSKFLTRDEAGKCLHTLGKCDTGNKYAYLGINVSNRKLTDIRVIPTFRYVIFVNISGNRLTEEAICVLNKMTYLLMLQADDNGLTTFSLDTMPYLQILTLNKNKITSLSNICQKSLERLELNYNEIVEITVSPLDLENLTVLELRKNLLTSTNGIYFQKLTRLYLAENQINKIEGLERLENLKVLHLRKNKISSLDGFHSCCAKLNYLNLRENLISKLSEFAKLNCLSSLETLVAIDNPTIREKEDNEDPEKQYRIILLAMLPTLKRINKNYVRPEEKAMAEGITRELIAVDFMSDDLDFGGE